MVVSKMAAGDATLLARRLWTEIAMSRSFPMKRTSSPTLVGSTGVMPTIPPDVIVNVVIRGIEGDVTAAILNLKAGGVVVA